MRLLFLYVENFRCHRNAGINLCADYCFHFGDGVLGCEKNDPLPTGFFNGGGRTNGDPFSQKSAVSLISAIVGENGSGKTSVAALLAKLFSSQSMPLNDEDEVIRFLYVVELDEIDDKNYFNGKSRCYCYDNLVGKPDVSEVKRVFRGRVTHKHFKEGDALAVPSSFRLLYYSPYFTSESINPGRDGAFRDVSTTGLISELGKRPISEFRADERAMRLDIISRFGERMDAFAEDSPMPFPGRMTISILVDSLREAQGRLSKESGNQSASNRIEGTAHYFEDVLDVAYLPDPAIRAFAVCLADLYWAVGCESKRMKDNPYLKQLASFADAVRTAVAKERPDCCKCNTPERIELDKDALRRLDGDLLRNVRLKLIALMKEYEPKDTVCEYGSVDEEGYAAFVEFVESLSELSDVQGLTAPSRKIGVSIRNDQSRRIVYRLVSAHRKVSQGNEALSRCLQFEFGGMSSGEMSYLTMFGRIDQIIGSTRACASNVLIFLDEVETTLHPEWQRQMVMNLIWYIENFTCGLRVHFVIASHSPLILSDIPRGNVCLLSASESDEKDGVRDDSQTFGANVFDLYGRTFGMDDGAWGRFAQRKIDDLLDKVNKKQRLDKRDLKVIGLIGDPFLRDFLSDATNCQTRRKHQTRDVSFDKA